MESEDGWRRCRRDTLKSLRDELNKQRRRRCSVLATIQTVDELNVEDDKDGVWREPSLLEWSQPTAPHLRQFESSYVFGRELSTCLPRRSGWIRHPVEECDEGNERGVALDGEVEGSSASLEHNISSPLHCAPSASDTLSFIVDALDDTVHRGPERSVGRRDMDRLSTEIGTSVEMWLSSEESDLFSNLEATWRMMHTLKERTKQVKYLLEGMPLESTGHRV